MNVTNDAAGDKPREKRENPYKGLHSYEETDKNVFYGRDEETETLSGLVRFNFISVVFGKAGIGKTSLLKAGVFPLLREEGFLPIPLRLNYSQDAPPLLEQIHRTFLSELNRHGVEVKPQRKNGTANPLTPGETLWEYFHRVIHFDPSKKKMVSPLLVLDQFEEFFTVGKRYNEQHKEAVTDELSWLIEDQCPPLLEGRVSSFSSSRPDVRVIISLREDYLPHLTELKARMASIDRNMLRVTHLNGRQAREIIRKPGRIEDEKVINDILHLFYPDDVEEDREIPFEKLEVEPSLLSLICFQIVEERKVKSFTKKYRDRILTRFYNSMTKGFPAEVEEFIEDKLLNEGGFRTLFRLVRDHPLKEYIFQLTDQRILRKVHLGEKEYIEIIHDVLAPIIKEKRDKRLDKIRRQKIQTKVVRGLALRVISIVAIILALITGYALYQKNRADKQYINAQINRLTAEAILEFPQDITCAVRIAEAAFEMGLPTPPARTYQALSDIGYSSFETPFYIGALHHSESIYTAVFSPDGRRILTACEDGTARIWNREGKVLVKLSHNARVFSAVFSPDGKQILTASWDKWAKLWTLEGKLLTDLKHNGVVSSAVFSPDGKQILTASWDKQARVWNRQGNLLVKLQHNDPIASAVFSPDGKQILTASWDKRAILWDLEGKLLKELKHKKALFSAGFSPDGKQMITVCEDGTVKVWDREGRSLKELKHKEAVSSAVFSPGGRRILTASADKTAKVWDLEGNLLLTLPHDGTVRGAVFSPDGRRVVTACQDGIAKIWQLENPILENVTIETADVNRAVFSPDGSKILTASQDHAARLWDLEGNLLVEFKRHKDAVTSAVFSADGNKILTAGEDSATIVWNLEGKIVTGFKKHLETVLSAVFSPNGRLVLTASVDGTAKVCDLKGNILAELDKHADVVNSAVFSPDGRLILTASRDKTAKMWNLEGQELVDFSKHEGAVFTAVFSPDGKKILTASEDHTIKLWSLEGELLVDLDKFGSPVYSAVFSPDGSRILTVSEREAVKLWDLEGNLLANLDKHKEIVSHAVFSPDSRKMLTVSRDGTAKLWYTPGAIYEWLKTSKLPKLSAEDKEKLGIR